MRLRTSTSQLDENTGRDLLTLARERSLPDLLEALQEPATLEEKPGPLPWRANQIARLIVAAAVQLIRTGTQAELADAGLKLIRVLHGESADVIAEHFPEASRLLNGAAVTIRAATPPDSSGGELTVLRGWNGSAVRALQTIEHSPRNEISRAELRERLDVGESYLSHLLAAMEASGLVVRIREGRTVAVHLGPASRGPEVQALLAEGIAEKSVFEELVRAILARRSMAEIEELAPGVEGIPGLWNQLRDVGTGLRIKESKILESISDGVSVWLRIRLSGTSLIALKDGGPDNYELIWVARFEDEKISKVETLTQLDGLPRPKRTSREQPPPDPQERQRRFPEADEGAAREMPVPVQLDEIDRIDVIYTAQLDRDFQLDRNLYTAVFDSISRFDLHIPGVFPYLQDPEQLPESDIPRSLSDRRRNDIK